MTKQASLHTAFGLLVLAPLVACSVPGSTSPVRPASQLVAAPESEYPGWSFFEQRAYPFQAPPGGGTEAARLAEGARAQSSTAPDPDAPRWTSLGPSPEVSEGNRFSGRVRAIAADPQHPGALFIGSAQGGVWRTLDDGATWKPLTDRECSLSIGAVAIDPVNPDIVYAGTGESPIGSAGFAACGMLRSLDRGETWSRIPDSLFPVPVDPWNPVVLGVAPIYDISVDPRFAGQPDTTVLLVASSAGVFRSTDGGNTFTKVVEGHVWELERDPKDPAIVYTAGRDPNGSIKVHKSYDGGNDWQETSIGLSKTYSGLARLAIAPLLAASPVPRRRFGLALLLQEHRRRCDLDRA